MKFIVEKEIFEKLPDACFGVVMAKGIDNSAFYPEIDTLLNQNIQKIAEKFQEKKVKEEKEVIPYRDAFRTLGINPNKYMCSIEALLTRIVKGKGIPHINPVVDLGNAMSLKHLLPMGAHDLSEHPDNICIRFSNENDTFLPFGSDIEETPDKNEVVYAVGNQIRTRRWTWRQSEHGKITSGSTDIFFPIDGFSTINKQEVLFARDELEVLLKEIFHCETNVGFVDINNSEMDL